MTTKEFAQETVNSFIEVTIDPKLTKEVAIKHVEMLQELDPKDWMSIFYYDNVIKDIKELKLF